MNRNHAFTLPPEALLRELDTDPAAGLRREQVESARRRYGVNAFHREAPPSLLRRIWDAAKEPMILMLIFAGLITLAVNLARFFTGGEADFWECVGIFAAIALSVIITVAMEGRSAKAFEALSSINEDTPVKVIRDGEVLLIAKKDVVVGDLLCVETGNKLPADARVLTASSLHADESALTGESMPVEKDPGAIHGENTPVAERSNMLYSGSFITGGSGMAVVTGVGDDTEFGKIARELSNTDSGSTPLQEKMAKLGGRITILGASAAAVVFLAQLVTFLLNGTASLDTISDAFITSIILIVAAVPEGLPTIVAVSLSINIIKMSKQNALVKKMIACETVGCINVICSDKTGTLTENRMTVAEIYADGRFLSPAELKKGHLLQNFCVNGTADVHLEEGQTEFIGNPTECALLVAASRAGFDYRALRAQSHILRTYPFSSEEKHMTTVVREADSYIAYTKGGPEQILSMCAITSQERAQAEAEMTRLQEQAFRVICFAHKAFSPVPTLGEEHGDIESGMIFDGFVAISDPLRADVYEAVARCRKAGIHLKMLTGDNLVTATAIANELGILDGDNRAVEAGALEGLTDEQLALELPTIRVIARSTPVIKMRVVNALKAQGDVVAVTGDGINDAPALKNADVGIAMGISGTEVSKEASDIVLLDDSFSTIVKAVQWGRGIYENFQRFIQFQLTVNLSSVIVVLASILAGFAAPFSALQLLWINIIMDGPPALTLGLEPIRGDLMQRQPTGRNASIVSKSMLGRIAANGIFISIVFLTQLLTNFMGAAPAELPTVLFTLFVVFQLFNSFNSRELGNTSIFRNVLKNRLMLGVVALTFGLQVVITQFGGAFFGTVPLSLLMWGKILAIGFSVVLVSELKNLLSRSFASSPRRAGKKSSPAASHVGGIMTK